MKSTLQCMTCGVSGESNFSKNDLGELVCDLCGTQSLQQSRNETQDHDDAIGTGVLTKQHKVLRQGKRKKRERKVKAPPRLVTLDNCLHVAQRILHLQAQMLSKLVADPELPSTVKALWFHFLHMWEATATRPLLNCFLESALRSQANDRQRLEDSGYESNWDLNIKGSSDMTAFSRFTYRDFLALLYLACRMRNLGIVTSDFVFWIDTGRLPFANLLQQLPLDLQESVDRVRPFFNTSVTKASISAPALAEHINYLHRHLDLVLPPFNAGIAATNLCRAFGFPDEVRTNCMRFMAKYPGATSQSFPAPQWATVYVDCELDFIGAIVVAIKLTRGWNLWQYEENEETLHAFPNPGKSAVLRKLVKPFVEMCKTNIPAKATMPPALASHVSDLKQLLCHSSDVSTTYSINPLSAFTPLDTAQGVPEPNEPTAMYDEYLTHSFYPIYLGQLRNSALGTRHGAVEYIEDALAKYMDMPPGAVHLAAERWEREMSKRYLF
ncbi:hypothetical protein LEN26_000286 [Aphanomyces euteiches]|nr:hypothetical protein LEN26_000286 [Aphanomyces euteiches]